MVCTRVCVYVVRIDACAIITTAIAKVPESMHSSIGIGSVEVYSIADIGSSICPGHIECAGCVYDHIIAGRV